MKGKVMDNEEKILEKIKKALNRENTNIICDGFTVDKTRFDFIAENESKNKIFIVGHSFNDDLSEDIVIDRKVADKAAIEAIKKIGYDPGDRGIEFCWVRIKVIDENKAICSIEYGVKVTSGNCEESKSVENSDRNTNKKLEAYEVRLIDELVYIAKKLEDLGKFIIEYNKDPEIEIDSPIQLLVSQFLHMREYFSILYLRASILDLPINAKDFFNIVIVSKSVDDIIDGMIASTMHDDRYICRMKA